VKVVTLLNLVFANEEELVQAVSNVNPLGKSDHSVIQIMIKGNTIHKQKPRDIIL
jgi:hypothetical protein